MTKQEIYRQIQREYEEEQCKNAALTQKRIEQVYKRLPIVGEIDAKLKELGIRLTRCAVCHAPLAQREVITKELAALNAKKDAALSSIGLTRACLEPVYTCPLCRDTGYVGNEKCSCMKKKLIDKYYSLSNLSSVMANENFDTFDLKFYEDNPIQGEKLSPRDNMRIILEKVYSKTEVKEGESPYFNFYFYGNSGLGKTFMCSCIAKKLLDRGKSVIYMTAHSLAALLEKKRFSHDEPNETDEAMDMLFEADLLIIDDLGTEAPNSVIVSEIFNVINNRLINRRAMVISSNLSPAQLPAAYSDRITSRIIGSYSVHRFYGGDIRMKATKHI